MGLTNEEIEAKKQSIIEFADIGEHLYQPVKTYSSGMFARLAFACAINVEPDILIVDEVLSVGDAAFQLKCFKKFEEFKKQNKTIIFVSHSMGDIIANCNRAIIIDAGKKIYDGNVKDGVDNYKKLITGMLKKAQAKSGEVKANNSNLDLKIKGEWKKHFTVNPNANIYGNGEAQIIDYGIFNLKGEPETLIESNEEVVIKIKALFNEDVECPTFSMTIKNFNGKELCGTNTNVLKINTGKCLKNETYMCEFKQKLRLAPR